MSEEQSLQKQYAPKSICYGCGPANEKGLQINSFVQEDKLIARFKPQKHHQAFVGTLCGGIIGTLLDCHCNWTAAYFLMQKHQLQSLPCTVTAEYSIKLLKPTPIDNLITLEAWVEKLGNKSAKIKGQLLVKEEVFDTCEGSFVMVKEGHAAFHRW